MKEKTIKQLILIVLVMNLLIFGYLLLFHLWLLSTLGEFEFTKNVAENTLKNLLIFTGSFKEILDYDFLRLQILSFLNQEWTTFFKISSLVILLQILFLVQVIWRIMRVYNK
jgi:hypothetical protein